MHSVTVDVATENVNRRYYKTGRSPPQGHQIDALMLHA